VDRLDPFSTLGLARRYDLDTGELERRYRDLQRALHPDRHTNAPASERRMKLQKAVEVNEAYRTLRDDQSRAEALLAVLSGELGVPVVDPGEKADPELLMEMMELRESLSEAKAARDAAEVHKLAKRVSAEQGEMRVKLTEAFDALPKPPRPEALGPIRALVSRLKYYKRFLDEVAVFEDEALT
jgi:molecular chaperone HscB